MTAINSKTEIRSLDSFADDGEGPTAGDIVALALELGGPAMLVANSRRQGPRSLLRHDIPIVMGEQDPDFPDPVVEARWITDLLHGELLLVPAGHYPHSQRPDIVGPAVTTFRSANSTVKPTMPAGSFEMQQLNDVYKMGRLTNTERCVGRRG